MKYKFIIHEPIESHNVYVVPEAASFEEAVELIKNDTQDQYLTEFGIHDATRGYWQERKIPLSDPMSLDEWRQRRKFVPYHADETGAIYPALEYPGGLFIEIGADFKYVLTIANNIYEERFNTFRALENLEETLYTWGIDEGLIPDKA